MVVPQEIPLSAFRGHMVNVGLPMFAKINNDGEIWHCYVWSDVLNCFVLIGPVAVLKLTQRQCDG